VRAHEHSLARRCDHHRAHAHRRLLSSTPARSTSRSPA
jgi:hypothetical protein